MRRGVVALALLGLLLASAGPAAGAGAAAVGVLLNGVPQQFSDPPFILEGRTLVPLRAVFEALGATVDWDNTTKTVTATRGRRTVVLTIGAGTARVDGRPVPLDVPGLIRDGRTYVPLRFVSEALGAAVGWDPALRRVIIVDLPHLQEGTDAAVALLRKAALFAGPVTGNLEARVLLGPSEAYGVHTVVQAVGQVRGPDAYYRAEVKRDYVRQQVVEAAVRNGRVWVRTGGSGSFTPAPAGSPWTVLGLPGGVDPVRPLATPLVGGVKAAELGETVTLGGQAYQELQVRLDHFRLLDFFAALAEGLGESLDRDAWHQTEYQGRLLVRVSDGFAREAEMRVQFLSADRSGGLRLYLLNTSARWSDAAGPIDWPDGLPDCPELPGRSGACAP